MSEVIWRLRQDHKNMARVMEMLSHEVGAGSRDEDPDLCVVDGILEYILTYPDLCHHPMEDLVFRRLKVRDPWAAAAVGDLEGEHAEIAAATQELATAVRKALREHTAPGAWFVEAASRYLTLVRHHMQKEEVMFFPPALRALTDDDWRAIDDCVYEPEDPIFDCDVEASYRHLRNELEALAKGRPGIC